MSFSLMLPPSDWQLCYVKEHTNTLALYFVKNMKEARGDSWSKRGYQDESSEPHDGFKIVFVRNWLENHWSPILTPSNALGGYGDPYWSVNEINSGAVAWLRWELDGQYAHIFAGETVDSCLEKLAGSGFKVYVEVGS